MIKDDNITDLLERVLTPLQDREIAEEARLQETIRRNTAHSNQDIISRYTVAPRPGDGYRPLARATQRDMVALFIPDTAFTGGDWQDFQRARDEAISWLRSHRYTVEGGGALCHGDSFSLDNEPPVYRDTKGRLWFNASISNEHDLLVAQVKARS